jgi:hypothetical protein
MSFPPMPIGGVGDHARPGRNVKRLTCTVGQQVGAGLMHRVRRHQ